MLLGNSQKIGIKAFQHLLVFVPLSVKMNKPPINPHGPPHGGIHPSFKSLVKSHFPITKCSLGFSPLRFQDTFFVLFSQLMFVSDSPPCHPPTPTSSDPESLRAGMAVPPFSV